MKKILYIGLIFVLNMFLFQDKIYANTITTHEELNQACNDYQNKVVHLISAVNTPTGILINWELNSYAKSYNVYRKENEGDWKKIGVNIINSSFKDIKTENNLKYEYVIKGFDGANEFDNISNSISIFSCKTIDNVTMEQAIANDGEIHIIWNSVDNAKEYMVRRKTENGTWEVIGEGIKNTEYVDKTGETGTKYYYTVRAYNGQVSSPKVISTVSAIAFSGNTFNITSFGADGNDNKSDYKAIQQALSIAKSTDKDINVVIPKGTYYIEKTLLVSSNTHLILDENAIIKRTDDDVVMLSNFDDKLLKGGYDDLVNVTIEGGTWDGNVQNFDANGYGTINNNLIYLYHGNNVNIINTNIKNCCGNHFIELSGINNSLLKNINFKNFIYHSGTNYNTDQIVDGNGDASISSEALQLDYTGKDNSSAAEPFDNTSCSNIMIEDCVFENCLSGIGNHHSEVAGENIIIKNNLFLNMKDLCISLPNMKNINILNNKANNIGRFIFVYNYSNGQVYNNSINNSVDETITIHNSDIKLYDNEINTAKKNGIYIDGGTIEAYNNQLKDIKKAAMILFDLDNGCIHDNIITSSGTRGISTRNSNIDIYNNLISTNDSDFLEVGIQITDNSNAKIKNNTITNVKSGIIIDSAKKIIINDNDLKNLDGSGIILSNCKDIAQVRNNHIFQVANIGIDVESMMANIIKNEIEITGNTGIYVKNSNDLVWIYENKVKYSESNGIGISNSKIKINNNTVLCSALNSKDITVYGESSGEVFSNFLSERWLYVNPGVKQYDNSIYSEATELEKVKVIEVLNNKNGIKINWNKVEQVGIYQIYRKDNNEWILLDSTIETNYLDTAVEEGKTYTYNILAKSGDVKSQDSIIEKRCIRDIECVIMEKSINNSNGIEVKWKPIKDATHYMVRRKIEGGIWESIADNVNNNEYIDTTCKEGIKYFYTVRAYNDEVYSPAVVSTTSCFFYKKINCVNMKKAINKGNGVFISWEPVNNAEVYMVRRKTNGGSWKVIAPDVKNCDFVDKTGLPGTTYYYTVRAYNGKVYSEKVISTVNATIATKLDCVEMTSTLNTRNGIIIKWNKVTNAKTYMVRRKTEGEPWQCIAEGIKETTFIDRMNEPGIKYYYTVRAYNDEVFSPAVISTVNAVSVNKISCVNMKKATPTIKGIEIKWESVANAKTYMIRRKVEGGSWECIGQNILNTIFIDSNGIIGTKYYYTVRAYNDEVYSPSVISTVNANYILSLDCVHMVSALNSSKGIEIRWNSVKNANTYMIRRKVEGGSWLTIAENIKDTNFIDKTGINGIRYYYTVRAYNGEIYSPSVVSTVNAVYSPTIENVRMEDAKKTAKGIMIRWNPVCNAKTYMVRRKKEGDSQWEMIANDVSDTTFIDNTFKKNVVYYYTVRAYNDKVYSPLVSSVVKFCDNEEV